MTNQEIARKFLDALGAKDHENDFDPKPAIKLFEKLLEVNEIYREALTSAKDAADLPHARMLALNALAKAEELMK